MNGVTEQNSPAANSSFNNYNINSRRYQNQSEVNGGSSSGDRVASYESSGSGGDRGYMPPAGVSRKKDYEELKAL